MSVEQAISKVRAEMTQNNANTYIQVVGGFLLDHLDKNSQDAEKILSADKTIDKSLEEMRKQAEKKQVKRSTMFTPQEGFTIVLKYFGIDAIVPEVPMVNMPNPVQAEKKPVTNDFNVNLEDF